MSSQGKSQPQQVENSLHSSMSEEWGWEPIGSEDGIHGENEGVIVEQQKDVSLDEGEKYQIPSDKMQKLQAESKQMALTMGSLSLQKGITSSPSFQELERAIGATLAISLSDEFESPVQSSRPLIVGNAAYQKRQHQMLKLQQRQQLGHPYRPISTSAHSPPMSPVTGLSARAELGESFINEDESRAIILFHSAQVSAVKIRDACQKFGVLYYIRPEFHGKGVTLLSYFDLRSAVHAHASLAEDLGAEAEASAHYSVMLHAANNNSEEFRLVVRHLPPGRAESDIQSIFSRYGQLRSIQRTFETGEPDVMESTGVGQGPSTTSYSVEYYNIQDARLAASELCATSGQLWGTETTVTFAPLDSRKQLLCRKLLATLSRWRAELATNSFASPSAYQIPVPMLSPHLYQQHQRFGSSMMEHASVSPLPMMVHPGYLHGQMAMSVQMPMLPYRMPAHMYHQSLSPHGPHLTSMSDPSIAINTCKPPMDSSTLNISIDGIHGVSGLNPISGHEITPDEGNSQIFRMQSAEIARMDERNLQRNIDSFKFSKSQQQQMQQVMSNGGMLPRSSVTTTISRAKVSSLSTPPSITSNVGSGVYDQRPHHHNGGHGHGRRTGRVMGQSSAQSTSSEGEFALDVERLKQGIDTRTTVMVGLNVSFQKF